MLDSTTSSASSGTRRTVVQVIDNLRLAGAERVVVDLTLGLAADWDVRVVVDQADGGPLEQELQAAGIPIIPVPHRMPLGIDGIFKLARLLAEIRPDVVHTHLMGSDIQGRLAGLLARIPVIVSTQHDDYPRPWHNHVFRVMSSRVVAGTIACSESVEAFCRDHLKIPESRLFRVDNGVDTTKYVPRPVLVDGPPKAALVGSLIPRKAHRYLLEAMPAILERCPEFTVRFAGEGPEEGSLRETVARLGLGESVEFLGAIPDVPGLLAEADIFLLPSLDEGLSIAMLEGMAAGDVVIATDVATVSEVLEAGSAGYVIPPGDSEALSSAILHAIENPAEAQAVATRARERVEEQFSLARTVERYSTLYSQLLEAKGR